MVACTGWTWDYVHDELGIREIVALNKYYGENPPLHLMVKTFLGIKSEQTEQQSSENQEMTFGDFANKLREEGII